MTNIIEGLNRQFRQITKNKPSFTNDDPLRRMLYLASVLGLVAAQRRFSTYYVNCHQLIEQLKKVHFENRLPDKLKVLAKYRMLIIDEIGYLPMDIQGANLFFQLITKHYERTSTVFTSNKTFCQWNEVFADVTIASTILDRVLHHCTVINIKGESYRLKERKKLIRQKQQIVSIEAADHGKDLQHKKKSNMNRTINSLRNNFWRILLENDPQVRHDPFDQLYQDIARFPELVRPGRSQKRFSPQK